MKIRRFARGLSLLALGLLATGPLAAADWWPWTTTTTTHTPLLDGKPLNRLSSQAHPTPPAAPSVWDQMGNGVKSTWQRLVPPDDSKKAPPAPSEVHRAATAAKKTANATP